MAFLCVSAISAFAQAAPNFSGEWVLDAKRSRVSNFYQNSQSTIMKVDFTGNEISWAEGVSDKKDFSGELFTNRRLWKVFKLGGKVVPIKDIYGRSNSSYVATQEGNKIIIVSTTYQGDTKDLEQTMTFELVESGKSLKFVKQNFAAEPKAAEIARQMNEELFFTRK